MQSCSNHPSCTCTYAAKVINKKKLMKGNLTVISIYVHAVYALNIHHFNILHTIIIQIYIHVLNTYRYCSIYIYIYICTYMFISMHICVCLYESIQCV